MKKLEKAQMGKIIKAATNFAGKNKDMKTLLKVNAALGTGTAGWMAVDQNAKKKKLGVYGLDSLANKKQMGGPAKPNPSKPIDFKEAKAKAKYNPNIIEEKERAVKNSAEYKIKNFKPYQPIVAKKGGAIKTKSKK
jgi:hypothetical protein